MIVIFTSPSFISLPFYCRSITWYIFIIISFYVLILLALMKQ